MAAGVTRSLFIQIGGGANDLTIAAKAGKSALLELGNSADDVQATVRGAFEKLGSSVSDQAKAMEQAYARTFANIRTTAQAALKAPTSDGAATVLNLGAARQEAAAAEASAAFLRTLSDAQTRLVESGTEASAGTRSLAVSLELQAIAAERNAIAARESAAGLELLASESGVATDVLLKLAATEGDAAAAALEAAQAQEQLATRADRLLSSVDPLHAAQQRYNSTVGEATALLAEGALSTERFAQVQNIAAAALREVADAAGVASEKQRALYATQAEAANIEVRGNQAQDAIAQARDLALANKSAADSFEFFRKVGVAEAQDIQFFESTTVQAVVEGSQRIALANKSAAQSFDVFRAAGLEEAQGAADIAAGHNRIGSSGLIAEHVVRSFSDSILAGQSPVRSFALEVPRIAEAMQFLAIESNSTTGTLGKFAGFMGGPWGLAITLGVSLLAPLVAELIEGGSASDKMHGKVMDLVSALNDEADATAAAQKALAEYNAEKQRGRDQDAASTHTTLDKAKADLQGAIATRAALQAEAQRYFNQQANSPTAGPAQAFAGLAVSQRADAQTPLIAGLQQAMRNIEIDQAKEAAKAAADPIEAIRQKYEGLATAAEAAAAKNDKLAASLKGTLSGYAIAEAAEIKAAEAKREADRRSASENRQVGRQINLSQAEDIVHGIGGTVTSSYRSTAKQAELYASYKNGTGSLAARPGTSLHETGQALDVAKTAGISLGALKKAFEDAGVHLTEALDEGNHYHVGFGPKGSRGPSAETLAHRQQSAENRAAGQDGGYQNALRAALDSVAQEQDKQPQTAQQRYETDTGKAADDYIQRSADLEDQVGSGKLTAAQAQQLESLAFLVEQLREQGAVRKRDTEITDEQFKLNADALDVQQELAKLDTQLAPTREARLTLEKQILAGQQAAYRAQLDRDIANAQTNPGAATKAVIAYQSIDRRETAQNADLAHQYGGPGQKYLQGLNGTSISDSLQAVQVDGLSKLDDGLQGVLSGTKSISSAFHDMATSIIADILKIGIEQAIIKPIATNLFGGSGGVGSAGAFSFLGHIFGHADGGHITGAGTGKSDSIVARLSNGEFVVNAASTKRFLPMLHAINDNKMPGFSEGGLIGTLPTPARLSSSDMRSMGRPAAQVTIGVAPGQLFEPYVAHAAGAQVQQAAPYIASAGATLGQQQAARKRSRSLG